MPEKIIVLHTSSSDPSEQSHLLSHLNKKRILIYKFENQAEICWFNKPEFYTYACTIVTCKICAWIALR